MGLTAKMRISKSLVDSRCVIRKITRLSYSCWNRLNLGLILTLTNQWLHLRLTIQRKRWLHRRWRAISSVIYLITLQLSPPSILLRNLETRNKTRTSIELFCSARRQRLLLFTRLWLVNSEIPYVLDSYHPIGRISSKNTLLKTTLRS